MIVDLSNKNNAGNMPPVQQDTAAEEVIANAVYNALSVVDDIKNRPEPEPYDDTAINSRVNSLEATIGTIDAELSNILGE